MKRLFVLLVVLGGLAAVVAWWATAPRLLSAGQIAAMPVGDAVAGERLFWAGGCASCHAAPEPGADKKLLSGGHAFKTDFGTFYAPNISPHPDHGLGKWTLAGFSNAMKAGVSPEGQHYYPAFPYTYYQNMLDSDVAHLWAYMRTLPVSDVPNRPHDIGFPFNIRRGLGVWKTLYMQPKDIKLLPDQISKGEYLVEALAHCGACHTPRDALGGPDKTRAMAGAVAPDGKGNIPNITSHADGINAWSQSDLAESLATGFTPEFDSFGSTMADVAENTARLTDEDRQAIAAYIKSLPPVASTPRP
ncbi:MAG: cytochrome c [Pseudomonadota bacterium]